MAEALARPLFQSERISLSAIDPEQDATLLADWMGLLREEGEASRQQKVGA